MIQAKSIILIISINTKYNNILGNDFYFLFLLSIIIYIDSNYRPVLRFSGREKQFLKCA